jgi:hypothetical protein
MDPKEPYDWTLFWGYSHHIPYGKDAHYEIYHDKQYPSYLLLPVVKSTD